MYPKVSKWRSNLIVQIAEKKKKKIHLNNKVNKHRYNLNIYYKNSFKNMG
jgi:hypothetical protein